MIRIDKCVKNPTCIVMSLDGFMSIVTEEDQRYFINWMKENKPDLMQ